MKIPADIRYLAVEGVIGVGKTSLCQILAKRWEADLLLENFAENPFLSRFYENSKAWAFQTQMFFLLSRHRQLQETFEQVDMFRSLVVSDYTADKDRIFAMQTLSDDELAMYNVVANALQRQRVTPNFIIYLQASVPVIQQRIRKRDRSMERKLEGSYLRDLVERYNHHFFHYSAAPVLVVNTDEIDFVENAQHQNSLLRMIETFPPGMSYYSPSNF